jgi:glucuronokinase
MREFAELTDRFRRALEDGDVGAMHAAINRNFDLRAGIVAISDRNWQLVNTARNTGASAKFCGSGGAVVGICEDEPLFRALATEFAEIGAHAVRPEVAPPLEGEGAPTSPPEAATAEEDRS